MNWDAVGAIAELIGAGGVIASLLYLATQIRRSAEEEIASGFQRSIDGWHVATANLLTGELAELYRTGAADYDALSETDRLRFHVLLAQLVDRMSTALEFEQRGVVPSDYFLEGEGSNFTKIMEQVFSNPGVRRWWELEQQFFSPRFRRWVDERREPEGPRMPLHVRKDPDG